MLNVRPPDSPARNWRDFFVQIATISAGLLIAISLEGLAETIHWHLQVMSAERALRSEISDSDGQSHEREVVSDCVDQRLDSLAILLDEADGSGKLPPVGAISMPPGRTWTTGAWQSTVSGQSGEHLPADRRVRYAAIYGFVSLLAAANAREMQLWTQLYTLVGPGRKIQPAEVVSLRGAIGEARMVNQMMGLGAVRLQQLVENFITPDMSVERPYRAATTSDFSICRPIGPVPTHYGAAPITRAIEGARQHSIADNGSTGGGVAGGALQEKK